jgi:hypothetical protein
MKTYGEHKSLARLEGEGEGDGAPSPLICKEKNNGHNNRHNQPNSRCYKKNEFNLSRYMRHVSSGENDLCSNGWDSAEVAADLREGLREVGVGMGTFADWRA